VTLPNGWREFRWLIRSSVFVISQAVIGNLKIMFEAYSAIRIVAFNDIYLVMPRRIVKISAGRLWRAHDGFHDSVMMHAANSK
jgi:hypothetical protein